MRRRLAVLGTGGTIASTGIDGGAVPTRSVDDLLQRTVAGLDHVDVVTREDVRSVLSPAMTPMDMWTVTSRARELVRRGDVDGVVVLHGTATMQETAYLADVTWPYDEPIAFTGAMLTAEISDSDGPRNLRHALLVAADDASRGLGAVLVSNGEIHSARDVRKEHKSAVHTFRSGVYGALGFVDEDRVIIHRGRRDRRVFEVDTLVASVPLIKAYSGMDDLLLRAAGAAGAAGVVIECFPGRGGLPPALLPAIRDLVAGGIPVLLAGAAEGRVSQTYGGPAGTRTFVEAGALTAGDLYPVKARILLMVLLSWADGDPDKLAVALREVAP